MNPKLSIVATSRNDNHGGDLIKRMQIFIDGIVEQSNLFRFDIELILVEWNPPSDKPGLYEVLEWPKQNKHCEIRIIEVPAELHNKLKYSKGLPLFQMIAKNVGIVRAKGEFILSTNIDIIFSNELMKFLCSNELKTGNLYRVDRHDVSRDMYKYGTINEFLAACNEHTIRISHKYGITDYIKNETDRFFPEFLPILFMGKRLWLIPGWKHVVNQGDKKYIRYVYKLLGQYRNWLRLHTNACGDFTLMARKDWFRLRGYPEWNIFSWFLDSVLVHQAYGNGVRIEELAEPMRSYHIEHSSGSGWTPEGEETLFARIKDKGIPMLTNDDFVGIAKDIRNDSKAKRTTVFNAENWGFADSEFPEATPGGGNP